MEYIGTYGNGKEERLKAKTAESRAVYERLRAETRVERSSVEG